MASLKRLNRKNRKWMTHRWCNKKELLPRLPRIKWLKERLPKMRRNSNWDRNKKKLWSKLAQIISWHLLKLRINQKMKVIQHKCVKIQRKGKFRLPLSRFKPKWPINHMALLFANNQYPKFQLLWRPTNYWRLTKKPKKIPQPTKRELISTFKPMLGTFRFFSIKTRSILNLTSLHLQLHSQVSRNST